MTSLALVDRGSGARLTWAALDELAGEWVARLSTAGVVRGSRVALIEPAGATFAGVLHACIALGATVVPLSPRAPEVDTTLRLHAVVRDGELVALDSGETGSGELCLIRTSGTTGRPKLVPLTIENHRASARGCFESLGEQPGDSWLLMLAPHHVGGFSIFMRSLFYRQTVVTLPRFDVDAVIATLDEERPTLVSAVPSMLIQLLDAGAASLLRGPRAILVGGAPAADEQVAEWSDLGLQVCPTYGMTETSSQVATVPPGRARELLGTAGFVHSEAHVSIEDGVIAVSGPVVSPAFRGSILTGDLGHFDERGALVVTGRDDDVIITGGEKVNPVDVETVLRRHPAVRDVAVAGRPDRTYGMVLEALVVGQGASAEELVAWSRERLPGYKVPRRVRFVESLPITDGGKLLRGEL